MAELGCRVLLWWGLLYACVFPVVGLLELTSNLTQSQGMQTGGIERNAGTEDSLSRCIALVSIPDCPDRYAYTT